MLETRILTGLLYVDHSHALLRSVSSELSQCFNLSMCERSEVRDVVFAVLPAVSVQNIKEPGL